MFSHFHGHGGRFRQARRGRDGEGFGPRWGGGRHGGGGRGFGRFFAHGDLRVVILHLISQEPRHGYDLIKSIEELTGGAYSPSPGVVYPTLTLLDDMGLIDEEKTEGARKRFAITEAGKVHLTEKTEEVEAAFAKLTAMGEHRERTEGGSVRRAMGNLRQVLVNRLGEREFDEATLHEIVSIIDEAAQKIERL